MTAKKRARNLLDYHDVSIALNKARSLASILQQLGERRNNLVYALEDGSHPSEAREWLHMVVGDALRVALTEAEASFRKSLTSAQMREQVLGAAPEGLHVVRDGGA
jgi:hypothetical protein